MAIIVRFNCTKCFIKPFGLSLVVLNRENITMSKNSGAAKIFREIAFILQTLEEKKVNLIQSLKLDHIIGLQMKYKIYLLI